MQIQFPLPFMGLKGIDGGVKGELSLGTAIRYSCLNLNANDNFAPVALAA